MTKDEFILWLHGFFEISNAKTLNEEQTALIRGEVEKFFHKATPDRHFDEYYLNTLLDYEKLQKRLYPIENPERVIPPPAQSPNWPKHDPNIHKWTPGWEVSQVTCSAGIYGQ